MLLRLASASDVSGNGGGNVEDVRRCPWNALDAVRLASLAVADRLGLKLCLDEAHEAQSPVRRLGEDEDFAG